jgi:8-oxo-dGTP diphosphatase
MNKTITKTEEIMKKIASLSIVEDTINHKYLMIRHHRGINKGCINFPGGKKEPNESIKDCVIRETFEETGIKIENPVEVGYIEFPTMNFYVHVFKSTQYSGSIKENEAEVDAFWVDTNKVPYEEMREADRNFLPDIISGQYVKRRFMYDENFHITEIVNL